MSRTAPATATPVAIEICWATALIAVACPASASSTSEKTRALTPVKVIDRRIPPTKSSPIITATGSVVENEQGDEVGAGDIGAQNLAPGNYITRYWVDQNVMGVTITRLELSLHYTTNGSAVTATSAVETAHVNYNFVVNVSSNSHIHYVTGSHGFASAIWNGRIGGSVGGINFGIDIDKRHELTVSAAGFHSGSLYNI